MTLSKVSVVLALFAFLSPCGVAGAEDTSPDLRTDRPLSLEECIEYALAHHNSVLAAESDLAGSKADVRRARAGYMPRITVGSSFTRSGYEGQQVGTGVQRTGTFENQVNAVEVAQTLLDGGRTRTAIRQASAMRRVAHSDVRRIRQERVLAVTTAYFDVLRARRLADIAGQSIAEAEEQRELIQARIESGDAAKIDIYPVEVQLANAKLGKLQADNDARVAGSSLRNEMGLPSGPDLRLADVQEPAWEILSLDRCLASALRERPEILRSIGQVHSAKAALSLAKLQRLPVPAASISYDRGLGGTGYESRWSVGAGLSMNVFDGGAGSQHEAVSYTESGRLWSFGVERYQRALPCHRVESMDEGSGTGCNSKPQSFPEASRELDSLLY